MCAVFGENKQARNMLHRRKEHSEFEMERRREEKPQSRQSVRLHSPQSDVSASRTRRLGGSKSSPLTGRHVQVPLVKHMFRSEGNIAELVDLRTNQKLSLQSQVAEKNVRLPKLIGKDSTTRNQSTDGRGSQMQRNGGSASPLVGFVGVPRAHSPTTTPNNEHRQKMIQRYVQQEEKNFSANKHGHLLNWLSNQNLSSR